MRIRVEIESQTEYRPAHVFSDPQTADEVIACAIMDDHPDMNDRIAERTAGSIISYLNNHGLTIVTHDIAMDHDLLTPRYDASPEDRMRDAIRDHCIQILGGKEWLDREQPEDDPQNLIGFEMTNAINSSVAILFHSDIEAVHAEMVWQNRLMLEDIANGHCEHVIAARRAFLKEAESIVIRRMKEGKN